MEEQTPTQPAAAPIVPPGGQAPGSSENLPTQPPQVSTEQANMARGEEPKKNNTILIIVLILVVITVVVGAGFLFLTEQGKNLIGLGSNTQQADIAPPLPTNSGDTSELQDPNPVIEPDYMNSSGEDTVDGVLTELEQSIELGGGNDDFDDFDSSTEFGVD